MATEEPTAVDNFNTKHPDYRMFYTKEDVQAHDTFDSCWVSFFNTVYDLTSLIQANKDSELSKPIIKAAGCDITHWFDTKSQEPKSRIDLETGYKVYESPMGRFIHLPPAEPSNVFDSDIETPWWRDAQTYCIGTLTSKQRPIRITNT